ncbi:MAG TPA: alpha-amylase family glycosyl hydrolase [Chryseosolibacter sp.]
MSDKKSNLLWWQDGIFYQIYPRSFQDSNGDGIGDLPGIVTRLDYLRWLGIKTIWLSPIYPSPMIDFGYDISDYRNIHPLFGTLADFDVLLKEVHHRGMKLVLDLVPNHTSDHHPWFLESRSSRDNPKRDWYIWKDRGQGGGYPNNWLASFGGSAWEWDEKTEQYYYHAYDKSQPDLNWRNPEVQEAIFDIMRFWLDKGVDGFRVDVMWHMIKDEQFRDNPPNPDYKPHMSTVHQLLSVYSADQPEVHGVVRKMREVLDAYDDRVMIGEIYLPVERLVAYYGSDLKGAHLPFNFQLISLPWQASDIASAMARYEAALPEKAWPNWVLSNHDRPRIVSRVGREQAFVAAMLLLTARGTITLYYGDEIGMRDVAIPLELIQDPRGRNMPDKNLSRDPARTPMQWDDSPNAGFTSAVPWLPVDRLFPTVNVSRQREDRDSLLALYKRLIALRQREPALTEGELVPLYADDQLISYLRQTGGSRFLVALNLTHRPCYFRPKGRSFEGIVEIGTCRHREGAHLSGAIPLEGDEGIIIRLK